MVLILMYTPGTCWVDVVKYSHKIGLGSEVMAYVLTVGLMVVYVPTVGFRLQRVYIQKAHIAFVSNHGITAVGVMEVEWIRFHCPEKPEVKQTVPKLTFQSCRAQLTRCRLETGFIFLALS